MRAAALILAVLLVVAPGGRGCRRRRRAGRVRRPHHRDRARDAPAVCARQPLPEGIVKIRLHGTEDECHQITALLEQVMTVQAVSEPYPDRGRSVLVRVYVEGIPRGDQ